MFRMTLYGHRLSNGGLTDPHLPLDVPGGSPHLGYLRRVPVGHYPNMRVKSLRRYFAFYIKGSPALCVCVCCKTLLYLNH